MANSSKHTKRTSTLARRKSNRTETLADRLGRVNVFLPGPAVARKTDFIDALLTVRRELDAPEAARVQAKHDAAKARNARLRAHNLRRSLIARGVIKPN